MSLQSALVDRARIVTREKTARKVDGRTVYADVIGPWFKCRVGVEGFSPEQEDDGRLRAPTTPIILYWTTDLEGQPVTLDADDEIEVDSNQEGRAIWQVVAQPLIIRKKVVLLGAGYAQIRRIKEP